MDYFIYRGSSYLVNTSSEDFDQRLRHDVINTLRSVCEISVNFPLGLLSGNRFPYRIETCRRRFLPLRHLVTPTFQSFQQHAGALGINLPDISQCTTLRSNDEIIRVFERGFPSSFDMISRRLESSVEEVPNMDLNW